MFFPNFDERDKVLDKCIYIARFLVDSPAFPETPLAYHANSGFSLVVVHRPPIRVPSFTSSPLVINKFFTFCWSISARPGFSIDKNDPCTFSHLGTQSLHCEWNVNRLYMDFLKNVIAFMSCISAICLVFILMKRFHDFLKQKQVASFIGDSKIELKAPSRMITSIQPVPLPFYEIWKVDPSDSHSSMRYPIGHPLEFPSG